MSKSFFIFITLIFSVNCWSLIIFEPVINDRSIVAIAIAWALFGLFWFRNRSNKITVYDFRKYNIYFFLLVIAFSLSVVSSNIFWNQDLITGILVNRVLIWYIYLPILFYIQPSENDIIKAISYYTVVYFSVWILQVIIPYPITQTLVDVMETGRYNGEISDSDFGQQLVGYPLILILLYYKTQKLIVKFNYKTAIQVLALLVMFFLIQNRSSLFFALIVFVFALFKIRSQYKFLLILLFSSILVTAYIYSIDHWNSLFQETIEQLNDPDYNRWKSFYFFMFHYSPHWICNIIGNGLMSANVPAGKFIQDMMDEGYYQFDNGILGFWSEYGIIPIIILYTVIFKLIFQKQYPFYVKAIAAHILFVPIAWDFRNIDTFNFILIMYFLAYYNEKNKVTRFAIENKRKYNVNKIVHSIDFKR